MNNGSELLGILFALAYIAACAALAAAMAGLFMLGQIITGTAITSLGSLITAGVVGSTIVFAGLGLLFGLFASARTGRPGWLLGGVLAGAAIGTLTGVFHALAPFVMEFFAEEAGLALLILNNPSYTDLLMFNAVTALFGTFIVGIGFYLLFGLIGEIAEGEFDAAPGFEPTLDTDLDLSLSSKLAKRADLDFGTRDELLAVTPKQSFINFSIERDPANDSKVQDPAAVRFRNVANI